MAMNENPIKEVADRFGTAWAASLKGGPRPRIEDFSGEVEKEDRHELLIELLKEERQWRQKAGEQPAPEEYLGRLEGQDVPDREAAIYRGFGWKVPPEKNAVPSLLLAGAIALERELVTPSVLFNKLNLWVGNGDPRPPFDQAIADGADATHELSVLVEERLRKDGYDVDKSLGRVTAPEFELFRSLLLRKGGRVRKEFREKMRLVPGGRFVAIDFHEGGGFGNVFVALDKELGREVGLKELKEEYAYDPDHSERFIQEAKITGMLPHPGIAPIYGLGVYPDERPYYAMRFLSGGTFDKEIKKHHGNYDAINLVNYDI